MAKIQIKKSPRKVGIGIVAIIFGLLVIVKPDLLGIVVGIYLIIMGVLNLMD